MMNGDWDWDWDVSWDGDMGGDGEWEVLTEKMGNNFFQYFRC